MPSKEALHHHGALLLDGAAERNITLQIDDPAPADRSARGNAAWRAKGVVAEIADSEGVDLTKCTACHIDHDRAFVDLLV